MSVDHSPKAAAASMEPSTQQPQSPAATSGTRLDAWYDSYADRTRGMKASEIRALFSVASRPEVVSLAGGMPNLTALPMNAVAEVSKNLINQRGAVAMQYGSAQGEPVLREQICEVMAEEAIAGHPDDVVVTTGSQQALDLVTRIFIDPGDVVLAEAPSYVGALGVFRSYQADVFHITIDKDGLVPEALEETILALKSAGRTIKFLYIIPNFHNPAGVSISLQRRPLILAIAKRYGILVIEDNPYGLLGFDGEPNPAIKSMDDEDSVIYLGSFSKTFAPGYRVGWALAPHAVREKLVLASESAILCPSNFSQMSVSSYLTHCDWRQQIVSYREIYCERRDAMLSALSEKMSYASWNNPTGGFYVWVKLPDGIDAKAMLPRAVTGRVAYVPGTAFYMDGQGSSHIRLSFCYPSPKDIKEGVRRLAKVIDSELDVAQVFGTNQGPRKLGPSESIQSPSPDQV